MTETNIKVD